MPGPKSKFTPKQDRLAEHIADGERKAGKTPKAAKSIGYATVQKIKSGGVPHTRVKAKP